MRLRLHELWLSGVGHWYGGQGRGAVGVSRLGRSVTGLAARRRRGCEGARHVLVNGRAAAARWEERLLLVELHQLLLLLLLLLKDLLLEEKLLLLLLLMVRRHHERPRRYKRRCRRLCGRLGRSVRHRREGVEVMYVNAVGPSCVGEIDGGALRLNAVDFNHASQADHPIRGAASQAVPHPGLVREDISPPAVRRRNGRGCRLGGGGQDVVAVALPAARAPRHQCAL